MHLLVVVPFWETYCHELRVNLARLRHHIVACSSVSEGDELAGAGDVHRVVRHRVTAVAGK